MLISAAVPHRPAIAPGVDPVAAFKLRCEAKAHLYGAGELDLHNAVDELAEFARKIGINHSIGIDDSQAVMAEALRPVREWEWAEPNGSKPEPNGSAEPSTQSRTPTSTIDALFYALRRGLSCFADSGNVDRLRRCDETAIRTITAGLLTWPGKTADGKPRPWLPAWTKDDVIKLVAVWRSVRSTTA